MKKYPNEKNWLMPASDHAVSTSGAASSDLISDAAAKPPGTLGHIERPQAEAIGDDVDFPPSRVPDDGGELAVERGEKRRPVRLPALQQELRIGVRLETDTRLLEMTALAMGIEEFADEDDGLVARSALEKTVRSAKPSKTTAPNPTRFVTSTRRSRLQPRVMRHAADHRVDDIFEPGCIRKDDSGKTGH